MKLPLDRAKNFLIHADRDISAFDILKGDSKAHPESICFHAQQAVEKILKAVLLSRGIDPTRTHDLAALAMAIQKIPLDLPLTIEVIVQNEQLYKLQELFLTLPYDPRMELDRKLHAADDFLETSCG